MQYTDKELAKLIEDVEKEFTAHLSKAEGSASSKLAKSEDSAPKKDEDKEKHDEKHEPEHEEEHKEAPKHEHEEHEEHHEESHEEHGHAMDPEEKEYMDKMYHSMAKHELMAHHESIKSALAKCVEAAEGDVHPPAKEGADSKLSAEAKEVQKSEDAVEPAAPGKIPGAKSEASKANGEKINKSEHERRNGGKIEAAAPGKIPGAKSEDSDAHGDKINKSESSEITLLKAENEELKKNFTEFLTKLAKKVAPQGKAITNLDVIAKSEAPKEEVKLTSKDVTAILTKKTADPTLAKSDRELINAYYNGASLNSIAHLLK